jgi:hypothetical protein
LKGYQVYDLAKNGVGYSTSGNFLSKDVQAKINELSHRARAKAATEVKDKVLPTADTAQSIMMDLRPKIDTIATNVSETTSVVRGQIERLDAIISEVVDRTRLQVIRADELLNLTMNRIEETGDVVHRTVVSPARQLSGLVKGVMAGLEFLRVGKRGATRPEDGRQR